MNNKIDDRKAHHSWHQRISYWGAIAALVIVVLTVAEIIFFTVFPQPGSVREWFELFQENRFIGLLEFWGLEVPMYIMFIPFFLSLYLAMGRRYRGRTAVALIFVLVGTGIFLATNNPFTMYSLSRQFTAASTQVEKQALIAAGKLLLAGTGQRAVGGFNIALFLVSIAGVLVSTVIHRDERFNRSTGLVGILAYGLSLTEYLRQALTSSAIIALFVILPGALLLIVWFVMAARTLFRLSASEAER